MPSIESYAKPITIGDLKNLIKTIPNTCKITLVKNDEEIDVQYLEFDVQVTEKVCRLYVE